MGKNNGKNMSKNLSSKYTQKLLGHAKQSATDTLKTASKRAIRKIAKTTGHLIGNKTANGIREVSKISPRNSSKIAEIEHDKKIPKERYISPEERHKIIHDLRLMLSVIIEYQKIMNLLDNTPNQPSRFRTKNMLEINDNSRGTYSTNSQIKFKTWMLKSSLCDYSYV